MSRPIKMPNQKIDEDAKPPRSGRGTPGIRPPKKRYQKYFIDSIRKHLLSGGTIEQWARARHFSPLTVATWQGRYPEFKNMLDEVRRLMIGDDYRETYPKMLETEFFEGGNLMTFSGKVRAPLAKAISWLNQYPEFKESHAKAVECSIAHLSQQLMDHMAGGYSFETFGASIGEPISELKEWLKRYKTFADSKDIGEKQCVKYWEELGIDAANGNIDKFPNQTYMFTMKNKAGWKDGKDSKGSKATQVNIAIGLPPQRQDIKAADIIEIPDKKVRSTDFEMLEG